MTTTTDSISVQAAKEHPLPDYVAGQVIGGRYEVVEKLGEGMLGAVYKVKSKGGEVQALKILRRGLLGRDMDVDRFNHELQLARQVSHPGIVQPLEAGEHEGTLFFTMEYVDGRSLRVILNDYRARGEDMPPVEMNQILTKTLEALKEAHKVTIHRNLKPENIILVEQKGTDGKVQRTVKLTDFALAHVVSPGVFADADQAREGAFDLAPEMGEFRDKAQANADLYSIGAIFYEMLTGYAPVGRYELPSTVRHGEVSEKIDDLVEIALAPNPQDRFQTAEDMLSAMRQTFWLYGAGETSFRRLAILLGALIVVIALAAIYFKQSEPTEEELRAVEMERRARLRADLKASAGPATPPSVSDPKYDDMVYVPAGKFLAGRFAAYDEGGLGQSERAEQAVQVGGFWIDKLEAHWAAKESLPDDTEDVLAEKQAWNAKNAGRLDTDITWSEAKSLCERKGKRLCAEDEWEKACKGPENLIYPYGDDFEARRCAPSGYIPRYKATEYEGCKSGYGVLGMGGGVAEWTSSKRGEARVVKPGEVGKDEKGTRCAGRFDRSPNFAQIHVGLRCCAD